MSSELKLVITFHQYWPAALKINIYTLSVLFPDLHGFSPLQSLPDMIASTQREHTNSTGNKHTFHYLLFNLWNLNWILTVCFPLQATVGRCVTANSSRVLRPQSSRWTCHHPGLRPPMTNRRSDTFCSVCCSLSACSRWGLNVFLLWEKSLVNLYKVIIWSWDVNCQDKCPECLCLDVEPVQLSVVAVQQRSRKTLPWTTVLLCCSQLWTGTSVCPL